MTMLDEKFSENRITGALTERRMVMAIDRRLLGINFIIASFFLFVLRDWHLLLINVIIHIGATVICMYDPDVVDKYMRYRSQGQFYSPHRIPNQKNKRRPIGFGQGEML